MESQRGLLKEKRCYLENKEMSVLAVTIHHTSQLITALSSFIQTTPRVHTNTTQTRTSFLHWKNDDTWIFQELSQSRLKKQIHCYQGICHREQCFSVVTQPNSKKPGTFGTQNRWRGEKNRNVLFYSTSHARQARHAALPGTHGARNEVNFSCQLAL